MQKVLQVDIKNAKKLAKTVAATLHGGEIFGLIGPLGAGKTTFTQALARKLHIRKRVTSPTFIVMQSFDGKLAKAQHITLYHIDLYRLKGKKEFGSLEWNDFLGKKDTVTVIEWADKAKKWLPSKTRYIHFLP